MKRLIICIFILFCVNIFAQKTYLFDYYTVYQYKQNDKDTISLKTITIANSKNANYFIKISTFTNNKAEIFLYDLDSGEHFNFNSGQTIDENTNLSSLFNNPVPFNIKLKDRSVDKYDVIHKNDTIIVRRYKNTKKKKIILDNFFIMESNEITKNQFYTSNLISAFKFDINKVKTDKIIKESYIITYKNNKDTSRKNIRTLTEIKPIDFKLSIPIKTNTTN